MGSCSKIDESFSSNQTLCIFCYRFRTRRRRKTGGFGDEEGEDCGDGGGVEVFQRFVKMLGKLLGADFEWLMGEKGKNWLGCCEDCEVTISSFCELNYQLISLKLKLEWKLKTLVSIMRLANRVPSRVKQLNEVFKDLGNDGGGGHLKDLKLFPSEGESTERSREGMSAFKNARQSLIKKCGRLLLKSQPRILLERLRENERGDSSVGSCSRTPLRIRCNDNVSPPNAPTTPPPPEPYFLGWTMSLAAVSLLATTTAPVLEACGGSTTPFSSVKNAQLRSPKEGVTPNMTDKSTETEDLLVQEDADGGDPYGDRISCELESIGNYSKMGSPSNSPVPDQMEEQENGQDEELTFNNFPSNLTTTTLVSHETLQENVRPFDNLHDDHNPNQLDDMELEGKSEIIDHHLEESIPLPLLDLPSEKTNSTIDKDPSLENEIRTPAANPKGYSLRQNRKRSYPKEEMEEDDDQATDEDLSGQEISEEDDDYISSSSSNYDTDNEPEPKPEVDKTKTVSISRGRRRRGRPFGYRRPTSISKFTCPVVNCGKGFQTEEELKSHQDLHGSFKCNFCDVVKEYAPDLAFHELKHASKTEACSSTAPAKLNCSRCPFNFLKAMKQTFVRHFLQTHLDLTFPSHKCSICQREGVSKKFRRHHFKRYHDVTGLKPSEIHKCDECPAYFRHSHHLVRHKALHFTGKCPECGKAFRTATALKLHLDAMHPHLVASTFKFKCTIGSCKKRFLTEKDLDKHRNQEGHLRDDFLFKCPQCESIFRGRKGLSNHLRYVHSAPMHTCKECGKSFKTKLTLEIHLECHLGKEEMVKCLKCGKEFKGARRLKRHMEGVHVDRSHICSECGKTFKTRRYLQVHLEYHKSPDEWKFQCSTCGKKFADPQKLRQHSGTHTKEKAFICQVCGGQYAHRHNWRGHMKTKHPEEYDKLESETNGKEDGPKNFLRRKGSKKGECIMSGQMPK